MFGMTTPLAAEILNAVLRNEPLPNRESLYVCLFTADPGPSGGFTNEVSSNATGYERVAISQGFEEAVGVNTVDNLNHITFPEAEDDWGDITHIGLADAATNGTLLWRGELLALRTIPAGATFQINSGSATCTIRTED
jgi:hypothetical protein